MKAYHGSSVLFDSFDLAHALEGDGKGKFGYGVNLTSSYGSAAHYSYNKHRSESENKNHYVYTVSMPDPNADNSLSLLNGVRVSDSIVRRVEQELGITIPEEVKLEGKFFRKYLANHLEGNKKTLKQMKEKSTVAGEKLAAAFLDNVGVYMTEWPKKWNPPSELRNYVVFDAGKIQIERIDKVELDDDEHQLIPGSERQIR